MSHQITKKKDALQKFQNFQLRDGFQSWIQGPDTIKTLYRIHLACVFPQLW